MLLFVDFVLFVVDCALFTAVGCGKQCCTYIGIIIIIIIIFLFLFFFNVTLQEKIDTVTVEGVENVEEEERIEIKTEEDYIQLVPVMKTEQEVSVLCSE